MNPLPADPTIERLVLGAIVTAGRQSSSVGVLVGTVSSKDFTVQAHQQIFRIARELYRDGTHVDRGTIWSEARKRNAPSVTLGLLVELDELPTLCSLDSYIGILREKTRLRAVLQRLSDFEGRAYRGDDSAEILADMARVGDSIAVGLDSESELRRVEEIVEEIGTQEIMTPQRNCGLPTPFEWLTQRLRFTPKSLTILAARPSVGKSALALQCALKTARHEAKTVLYSLEMSSVDLVRRMTSQQGSVNLQRLRLGWATPEERDQARRALEACVELGDLLLVSDSAAGTIPAMHQHLQKLRLLRKPAQFVVIDYLQLMTPVGRFQNRVEEVSSLSRGLKLLAQEFNVPILALSQLSRESEKQDREPRLSDLRESGGLEQDADNVIFLHRRSALEDEEQRVRLILAKQRGGPTGRCDLIFTKRFLRFAEMESEAA